MSKKRAFVRYSKQGKIVPGSLILTGGSHPNGPSTWKEVSADLCCDGGSGNVTILANTNLTFPESTGFVFQLVNCSGCTGNILEYNNYNTIILSSGNSINTIQELVNYLNTYYSFYGIFNFVGTDQISLQLSVAVNNSTSFCTPCVYIGNFIP